MVTFCNKCGSSLAADVRFCPHCGTPAFSSYADSGASPYEPTALAARSQAPAQIPSHEIEKYVATTGEIEMWVRIPTLSVSADIVIYMYYDNRMISSSQEQKTGVWDSNYQGVWHFPNGTTLSPNDSTSNGNNGTNNNGVAAITSQFTLYVDGVAVSNPQTRTIGSDTSPLTGSGGMVIGYHQAWNTYSLGSMDEVRISNTVRPSGWITTEYNNQVSPSTFYTLGSATTLSSRAADIVLLGTAHSAEAT
jgi:Concanavalin A-like lectin/glucanases superfamily/zinc-ribbon domain